MEEKKIDQIDLSEIIEASIEKIVTPVRWGDVSFQDHYKTLNDLGILHGLMKKICFYYQNRNNTQSFSSEEIGKIAEIIEEYWNKIFHPLRNFSPGKSKDTQRDLNNIAGSVKNFQRGFLTKIRQYITVAENDEDKKEVLIGEIEEANKTLDKIKKETKNAEEKQKEILEALSSAGRSGGDEILGHHYKVREDELYKQRMIWLIIIGVSFLLLPFSLVLIYSLLFDAINELLISLIIDSNETLVYGVLILSKIPVLIYIYLYYRFIDFCLQEYSIVSKQLKEASDRGDIARSLSLYSTSSNQKLNDIAHEKGLAELLKVNTEGIGQDKRGKRELYKIIGLLTELITKK